MIKFRNENEDKTGISSNIPHISSFMTNIDEVLASLSNSLYDIDTESKSILVIIGENGPLNEYQIGEKGNRYLLTRDSIRRRILGTTLKISLKNENFLEITSTKKYRTTKMEKNFGLTFKGMTAALSKMRFDDIYLVKNFYGVISELTNNKFNIVDLAILYAKHHLALIMCWHKMMGFSFTYHKMLDDLFFEDMTRHVLYSTITMAPKKKDWENYLEIGQRFFVLRHVIITLLTKITHKPNLFSNKYAENLFRRGVKYQNPRELQKIFERYILRDWFFHLGMLNTSRITPASLAVFDYSRTAKSNDVTWKNLKPKMNKLAYGLFSSLNLETSETDVELYSFEKVWINKKQ